MKIRTAVESDAAELSGLARLAKASWGYPAAWLAEWVPALRISDRYIRRNAVFVAESKGEAVGVVAVEADAARPEIAHLWISPERQGQGLGRRLVHRVNSFARQQQWSSLLIVSDPFAQAFYERLGAIRVGEMPAPVAGSERVLPLLRLDVQDGSRNCAS